MAERMIRTLTEKAKCYLFDADLPKTFWAEAINMAAYVANRMPCKRLMKKDKQTPEENFSNIKCDLSDLKFFGSKVMVLKPKQKRSKFDENSTKMVFVGYDDCVKGYRCVNIKTRKITVSRNVEFFEREPSNNQKVRYLDDLSEIEISDHENDTDSNESFESSVSNVSTDQNESLETSTASENDVTIVPNTAVNDSNDSVDANDTVDIDAHDTKNDPSYATRANTNNGVRSSSRSRTPFTPYQHMGHFAFFVETVSESEPNIM